MNYSPDWLRMQMFMGTNRNAGSVDDDFTADVVIPTRLQQVFDH
jgi:hypothetical protein